MPPQTGSDKPLRSSVENLHQPLKDDMLRRQLSQADTSSGPRILDDQDAQSSSSFEDSMRRSIREIFSKPNQLKPQEGDKHPFEENLTQYGPPERKKGGKAETVAELRQIKDIHQLSRKEIQKKNADFDARYKADFKQAYDNDGKSIENTISVEISGKHGNESYYTSNINLKDHYIEGCNNNRYLDIHENGETGRMPLSDIKYQSLRKLFEWLNDEKTQDTFAQPYKNSSFASFEPRTLRGGDIEESNSIKEIKDIINTYRDGKQQAQKELTEDEKAGRFFFARDTPECEKMLLTTIGKEKVFFTDNYFAHLDTSSVHVMLGSRSKYIQSAIFDLENKK